MENQDVRHGGARGFAHPSGTLIFALILFIDSSHVVSYGSDTVYELTAILPILKPGVLVHIHDIFLPYDYPSDWVRDLKFL